MNIIKRENHIFAMSKEDIPALKVSSGEIVIFETNDCYCGRLKGQEDALSFGPGNPATGPLYVEDAMPGDILKVEILDIKIASQGAMRVRPNVGIYGDYLNTPTVKIVPIRNNLALFNERLEIPVNPMIGVIGTAPFGDAVGTETPDMHGGNLDCKRIIKGSTVYLPVNTEGGLLSLGDLHALMGDGETAICGLEVAGEVTVKVSLIKNKNLPLPMVVEGGHIMTLASKESLDEAAAQASVNMHEFLTRELEMDVHEAAMLLSLVGDLKICQIVDPLITARMEVPLDIIQKYNYRMP